MEWSVTSWSGGESVPVLDTEHMTVCRLNKQGRAVKSLNWNHKDDLVSLECLRKHWKLSWSNRELTSVPLAWMRYERIFLSISRVGFSKPITTVAWTPLLGIPCCQGRKHKSPTFCKSQIPQIEIISTDQHQAKDQSTHLNDVGKDRNTIRAEQFNKDVFVLEFFHQKVWKACKLKSKH